MLRFVGASFARDSCIFASEARSYEQKRCRDPVEIAAGRRSHNRTLSHNGTPLPQGTALLQSLLGRGRRCSRGGFERRERKHAAVAADDLFDLEIPLLDARMERLHAQVKVS